MPAKRPVRLGVLAMMLTLVVPIVACGAEGPNDDLASPGPSEAGLEGTTLRVITHDSFNVSESVLQSFEDRTGITVELVKGGDAVQTVNQAVLSRDNPQGDLLFGIDNNLLTRAYDANLFVPYESAGLATVDDSYELDPEHRVTPVDHGDVCVNVDREHYRTRALAPPNSLEDLVEPEYADQLVVQNPSTSTPGLAFLLATIDHFGEDGWQEYWAQLKGNGVTVADGWEQAYYGLFSGGSGEGALPLVVSYASSPPAEVTDVAATPADAAPTGAMSATCYRQIEFAGILAGTDHEAAARAFIDFLLSTPFQDDLPLSMYVYPVSDQATLPEAFTKYAAEVDDPLLLPSDQVGANRDRWIEQWSAIFGA
jgi:thiamine transport system substrate-binding protein